MVIACRSLELMKTGKSATALPAGRAFAYRNYANLARSSPSNGLELVRLCCGCRKLHFSKETTSNPTKLSPRELAGTVSAASVSLRPAPVVFSTIRVVVDNVFAVLAQFIAPLANLLTFIRQTFVENALNLLGALSGTLQTNPAFLIVQTLLVVANETLSNVTGVLTAGGGTVLGGVQAGVDGVIDFVASFFLA